MPIVVNQKGICPHCKTSNRFEQATDTGSTNYPKRLIISGPEDKHFLLQMCRCTNCSEVIIFFKDNMIYPLGATRPPCPSEVPEAISQDYKEACLVEQYSKKAAAALTRRCLQTMLHDQGIKKKDLNEEIEEAITKLPSHLSKAIDAIRHIGNFATHPIKYQYTGEIVEV